MHEEEDECDLYMLACSRRLKKLNISNRSWMRMKIEQNFLEAEIYEQNSLSAQNSVDQTARAHSTYPPYNYGAPGYTGHYNSYNNFPTPPPNQPYFPTTPAQGNGHGGYGYY